MSTSTPTAVELSVVVPMYNEEESVLQLYQELISVLEKEVESFEIVAVDDGSRDQTFKLLRDLSQKDPRLCIIQLSRNFGQQIAYSAGLEFCRGRAVVTMDADLQDPPEILRQFLVCWRAGADVVYATRQTRQAEWWKRICYYWFYRLFRTVANIPIAVDSGDFCLMDRRVVDIIVAMPERNRFLRGIRSWVGFNQVALPVDRLARPHGKTKYSLGKLTILALDGLVSFSLLPLRLITIFGLLIATGSLLLALSYTALRLLSGSWPPGFATIVVMICFFSGIQLMTVGLIGEYIGRIFDEVRQRPLYLVRTITRNGELRPASLQS